MYQVTMATIRKRKRKDGTFGYTAQIRIMRDGQQVYQESQTFDRQQAAKAWAARREAELAEPGAIERANRGGHLLKDVIQRYLDEYERIRPMGKTKNRTLRAIARSWLGDVLDRDLVSQTLVEYAHWRRTPEGGAVGPATISNDIAHLGAVISVARPAWGYDIDQHVAKDARPVLKKLNLISTSRERDRRPQKEELDKLLTYFFDRLRWKPSAIHMPKVIAFAIFSTRRQEEICRIRWDDLDEAGRRVLVRDMKNPGDKYGNDVWCNLPDEAMQLILSMPRKCPQIFPYHAGTVSRNWTDSCHLLGIEDLTFHDLRHDGVSRLFEMDWDIPRVASVSGHRNWNSLRRYTHLRGHGDPYKNWSWMEQILSSPVDLGIRAKNKGGS
ncbi:site-specific integrase [Pseudomonas citronellolis]|uniref:site-specific integrase n=1 Tax=Pseudomonas citronellolis TaxID=53408 RepID=UPI0028F7097F|nr:site-specific integrase [Pseudomonas citronellolis]